MPEFAFLNIGGQRRQCRILRGTSDGYLVIDLQTGDRRYFKRERVWRAYAPSDVQRMEAAPTRAKVA